MTSAEDLVRNARSALQEGNRNEAAELMNRAASIYADEGDYETATILYERAAQFFCDTYQAEKCFVAFENATLMLVRQPSSSQTHDQIVRINEEAADIACRATEFRRAANFLFRAADFAVDDEKKRHLQTRAGDCLENVADTHEERGNLEEAVAVLKKVGRLYYTVGDIELGERISNRAAKIALRWAKDAKGNKNYFSAGSAMAEAAQITHSLGDAPEATRMMMEAGELYEEAGHFERAGNIYDAAQEAYSLQRLTTARRQAMAKAAEAYLKMEGTPEAIAPLLVKGGNMFLELGRDMKAKWAFKRASEFFSELAAKASAEDDIESKMRYLRFQAMSLRKWGRFEDAEDVYREAIEYYIHQAQIHEEEGEKEEQAISFEAVAEVLEESGDKAEAVVQLERALALYVELANDFSSTNQNDESSKFYSKAAECAKRLGNTEQSLSYHEIASDKAELAAKYYEEMGVKELSTIWKRTAGLEALRTENNERIGKGIDLLQQSAAGFKEIEEMMDSFDDLFAIFEALFLNYPDDRDSISKTLMEMDDTSRKTDDVRMAAIMSVIHAVESGNPTAALLALQEREEELLDLNDRLRALISQSKVVRKPEDVKTKDSTHWAYR
ncbi:MAG: hypothetical protein EAX81_05430 [Candidatus Thorarchaeota archaeon]|nr:hypothetical protein [Candidatus Thorarchaeota archaeon]